MWDLYHDFVVEGLNLGLLSGDKREEYVENVEKMFPKAT